MTPPGARTAGPPNAARAAGGPPMKRSMLEWARIPEGWALNLDGSDAARTFSLPRLELRAGRGGWTCTCHLPDGTSSPAPVGSAPTALAAKRAAVEHGLRSLGPPWDAPLRALL